MLANAAFLLVAVGVSVVASLILWLRHRKPSSSTSSVDDFRREMDALGRRPEMGRSDRRWRGRRPGGGAGTRGRRDDRPEEHPVPGER